jgi:hypothetical protein
VTFSDQDLVPNIPRPLELVIAGCASDARWRSVPSRFPASVEVSVDTLEVRDAERVFARCRVSKTR